MANVGEYLAAGLLSGAGQAVTTAAGRKYEEQKAQADALRQRSMSDYQNKLAMSLQDRSLAMQKETTAENRAYNEGQAADERKYQSGVFSTTPKVGVNPETGKSDQFLINQRGEKKWLDAGIDNGSSISAPVDKQKTSSFLVKNDDGTTSIAVGVFDPATGGVTTSAGKVEGSIVSKLGETASEQTDRKVSEAGKSADAKAEASRASDLISRGISAAESVAGLKRGVELLESVETGGVNAVANRAKTLFGIESADEGELSNQLSKAVLSQLRETFGAAFTENEGARLERIEAGFGKSPEANKRLLQQALRISERTAERARAAAVKSGDDFAVQDIDDLLSFSLSSSEDAAPPKPQQGGQKTETADNLSGMSDDELLKLLEGGN